MSNAPENKLQNLAEAAVLLVDGTMNDARRLSILLHKAGVRVTVAHNSEQALQRIESGRFDLLVTEASLPGQDGFALCRAFKQDSKNLLAPVVFVSGRERLADKLRGFAAGAVDYVTKPVQDEELLARLNVHLGTAKLHRLLESERRDLAQLQSEADSSQRQLSALFSTLSELLPGRLLDGKYRIDSKIGSGGFGVVYKATQLSLKRAVAVKVFQPTSGNELPVLLERFMREGVSAGRLNHPNVVAVIDSSTSAEGIPYLVMELMEGWSLREEMHAGQPLTLARCRQIIEPICDALVAAHSANVVHRDIKPENVFLHHGPHGEVVKVLDFGIAVLRNQSGPRNEEMEPLTRPGFLVGTPSYMAPERVRSGPIDGRSDVFSVGVMIFEMLTGQTPFGSDRKKPAEVLLHHLTAEPRRLRSLLPEVPEALDTLVAAMLSRDLKQRPTAQEVLDRWREMARAQPEVFALPASPSVSGAPVASGEAPQPTLVVETAQVEVELADRRGK